MKATLAGLFFVFTAALAFAQPDPRDSIIFESKTVYPGFHPGSGADTAAYVYLKVWITNKDTLLAVESSLEERSMSGGAYMTLARPRTGNGCMSRLTTTLGGSYGIIGGRYHSNSPDSFYIEGVFDPLNYYTSVEPPNPVRKALWEIKFDTVRANLGTIEFDSVFYYWPGGVSFTAYDDQGQPYSFPANFVKSVITVGLKGDLNLDGGVSPADVVLELQAVYLGEIPAAGLSACDLNCDGQVTAADITVMLNFKYLTGVWPC